VITLAFLILQDFVQLAPIEFNDKLRLASSWFGMCGISAQLSPVAGGHGIQAMHADTFDLHSFHTLTGTTFMMVTEPNTPDVIEVLRNTSVCYLLMPVCVLLFRVKNYYCRLSILPTALPTNFLFFAGYILCTLITC